MKSKSSAHYQREYRRRLREMGLVKKEVWIRPENARLLGAVERALRESRAMATSLTEGYVMDTASSTWTTESLFSALKEEHMFVRGAAAIELIDGVQAALHIVMREYGDLPLFVTVSGEQIIVEAVLWSIDEVKDPNAFNERVLRTHKYFPLSTISLDPLVDGSLYYQMFGALSATSIIANVVFEIETLAANVMYATEAYGDFLDLTSDCVT